MRRAKVFAKKITEWELLSANLRPHLAEMPFLQGLVDELDALIAQARALDSEQELVRGRLQVIVHKRQEAEKQGERLRGRATAHLKGSFGFASDDLVQFGVRPVKGVRGPRKTKSVETPTTPPATVKSTAK
jgi:hypothetical protein